MTPKTSDYLWDQVKLCGKYNYRQLKLSRLPTQTKAIPKKKKSNVNIGFIKAENIKRNHSKA